MLMKPILMESVSISLSYTDEPVLAAPDHVDAIVIRGKSDLLLIKTNDGWGLS